MQSSPGLDNVRFITAPCVGRCEQAPVAVVGQNAIAHANAALVLQKICENASIATPPKYLSLVEYRAEGGYARLLECVNGERSDESVIKELEDSGLRGLGGAGFPAGRKWRIVKAEPAPRLMAVNIDEGEPGTFKTAITSSAIRTVSWKEC